MPLVSSSRLWVRSVNSRPSPSTYCSYCLISAPLTLLDTCCWRAISIVSRLRSIAFQSAMATSLDETYPRRGTLQIVQWGVRTDSSMAIHSLMYGGADGNFPSLPIPISAMTVLQYYSRVIGGIEITFLPIQYRSPRR